MDKHAVLGRSCGRQGIVGQVFELGHAQIGNRNEVCGGFKASGGPFDLLQQAIHRLDIGVAAVVQHTAHHAIDALAQRGSEFLERLQPTTSGPTQPA